jgi:hypothetical protein
LARAVFIRAQPPGAVNRLGHVRDVSAEPETDLVAEDPEAAGPASSDRAAGDDTALATAEVRDRRLLDHIGPVGDHDLER